MVFGQTVHYGFVNYDDDQFVYANPHIAPGLTGQGIVWAFTHFEGHYWIPLSRLSSMLDCQFYGLNAGGHHLTNVLLHAAATILLFLIFWRMTGGLWPSALVAALFAVHPLHVESVAWVTERKDVLSGLFFVLTLGTYVWYVQKPSSLGRYLLLVTVFALGLITKPMLLTLPFVLLLLDYWPLGRITSAATKDIPLANGGRWGRFSFPVRVVVEKVPLFLLTGVFCVITSWTMREDLKVNENYPFLWRMGSTLIAYVRYVSQSLCPRNLAVVYPRPGLALPAGEVLAAFLVLASVTAATWVWRRRHPYLVVGWLWYLGMLVPVIGVVQLGIQAVADRFMYLPQIGLWIALAWAPADLCSSSPYRRLAGGAASALVLAVFMGYAWRQTTFWCDSETLWTHTLACTSRNNKAHFIFATGLADWGRDDEALDHYRKALEIEPDDVFPRCNIAGILAKRGRFDEAVAWYRQALEIQPDCVMAHNNLGELLARQRRFDEAAYHYGKALQIQPDDAVAYSNLGTVWMSQGRLEEAEAQFRKALEIQPDYAMAHNNLGNLLTRRGQLDEALAHYQKALEIQPNFALARTNVGNVLTRQGQFDEALAHYRKALEIEPNFALARTTMGDVPLPEASLPRH